jgi:hypothetical protein
MNRVPHTFEGTVHVMSARALLFQSHYWEAPMWLPLSQVEIIQDFDSPLETVVKVSAWLCGKNELSEFTRYTEEDMEKRNMQ